MTEDDIAAIADRAAERAIDRLMSRFGIYADEAEEFRKDIQHLRAWRTATSRVTDAGVRAVVLVIITGILGLIVVGFNAAKGGPS